VKTRFRKGFARDLKKVKDQAMLDRINVAIEGVEAAAGLHQIAHLKKMGGTRDFYRIRVGDFRIGIFVEGDAVVFVRCLPRADLYRFFP